MGDPRLMLLPRHCTKLSIPLLALPLSCTGDDTGDDEVADDTTETGDGDGDGDGDGGLCTEPGTTVPDFEPFVPGDGVPDPTCSTGWASDVPLQEPKWVAAIPYVGTYGYYYSSAPMAKALSGGGAVLFADHAMQWYDGEGTPGASVEHGFIGLRSNTVVVREADDHVFIAGPLADDVVIREFVDGTMVSELMVVTPGTNSRVAGLFEFSTDEWLIVGDEYDQNEGSEVFFMRVDAMGNQVLRKATSSGYGYYYSSLVSMAALDADENLLFGTFNQQWIVDPSDGSVINPSAGLAGSRDVVGSAFGSGFVTATGQNLTTPDGGVSLINGFGTNQWTRTYDRALTGEAFFDLDARAGGGFVVAGLDGIWWDAEQFQSGSQPVIIAFDEQGTAEWIGRLAIPGDARSVDVAGDGGVIAAGTSQTGGTDYDSIDRWLWIASW